MRALTMHANDLAQRTDDALRMQIVHAPGKSLAQRLSTLKSILSDSNMLGLFPFRLSLTVPRLLAPSLAHLLALLLLGRNLSHYLLSLSRALSYFGSPPLFHALCPHARAHTPTTTQQETHAPHLRAHCNISATHCNTLQQRLIGKAMLHRLQHIAAHLQHTAKHCNIMQQYINNGSSEKKCSTYYNTLQHTCNTLATQCNTLQQYVNNESSENTCSTSCNTPATHLRHTCNTLQHTATSLD